jgi:small subunit ribosomal protein S1
MESTNAASDNALQPKAHLTGKVIKTTIAGAVLDIGQKIPGVVHISQLSKDAVNRVEDVVKTGQVVDVWVRRVREDRVELTMVQPLGLEWKEIHPEMIVRGKVVRLEPYGAFIEIGAERPGMVHVSEISHDYVKNPAEVLKEGDEVEAKILDIDRRKRQIRLSIKAAMPKPEEVLAEVLKDEPKKKKEKHSKKKEETVEEVEEREPELTAFQIAFQKAQARADKKDTPTKARKQKNLSTENEEMLTRTLKSRVTDK